MPDRLSPEGALHSLIVSEPVDIETLDQLVDLVKLLLAEADRSRRHVLQNTTLLTKGSHQAHEIYGFSP